MSRSGGGSPQIKSTSTVTAKTPAGGTRVTTTTKIRELHPCSAGEQKSSGGCNPCPSRKGQGSPQMGGAMQRPQLGSHNIGGAPCSRNKAQFGPQTEPTRAPQQSKCNPCPSKNRGEDMNGKGI